MYKQKSHTPISLAWTDRHTYGWTGVKTVYHPTPLRPPTCPPTPIPNTHTPTQIAVGIIKENGVRKILISFVWKKKPLQLLRVMKREVNLPRYMFYYWCIYAHFDFLELDFAPGYHRCLKFGPSNILKMSKYKNSEAIWLPLVVSVCKNKIIFLSVRHALCNTSTRKDFAMACHRPHHPVRFIFTLL